MARHLPLDRRPAVAPPRRARRAEVELHHPRHRRPDPAPEAAHPGRGAGRQALAGAPVRADDRRLEEQGLRAEGHPGRRRPRLRQRPRPPALRRLPGTAFDPQRRRFRRPAFDADPHPARQSRRARRISPQVPLHPGRRIPGHQHRAVSVAAADGAAPAGQTPRRPGRRPQARRERKHKRPEAEAATAARPTFRAPPRRASRRRRRCGP